METIRTFVAVDVKVGFELESKWNEVKSILRNDNIKWVEPNSLHLTLFFLGDTPFSLVESISQKLALDLQGIESFDIRLQGFGTFGSSISPRIIWAGIARSESLIQLKHIVSNAILPFGFKEQQGDFSPHFTLGRVKNMRPSNELVHFINSNKLNVLQVAAVDKVIFYQSILKPNGPIYKPLSEIKLPCL